MKKENLQKKLRELGNAMAITAALTSPVSGWGMINYTIINSEPDIERACFYAQKRMLPMALESEDSFGKYAGIPLALGYDVSNHVYDFFNCDK